MSGNVPLAAMFRNLRSIQHIHLMPVNSRRGPAPASVLLPST
jgi:hypothetical protein